MIVAELIEEVSLIFKIEAGAEGRLIYPIKVISLHSPLPIVLTDLCLNIYISPVVRLEIVRSKVVPS